MNEWDGQHLGAGPSAYSRSPMWTASQSFCCLLQILQTCGLWMIERKPFVFYGADRMDLRSNRDFLERHIWKLTQGAEYLSAFWWSTLTANDDDLSQHIQEGPQEESLWWGLSLLPRQICSSGFHALWTRYAPLLKVTVAFLQIETFKVCELSGKNNIPAQHSKISFKIADVLSFIWGNTVLFRVFVHVEPS